MDLLNIIFLGLGALRKFLAFPSFRNLDRHEFLIQNSHNHTPARISGI